MPNQHPKSSVAWRCRREEYLRASARYDDLIKEGYMPADSRPKWSIIVGGRMNYSPNKNREIGLYLLKGVAS